MGGHDGLFARKTGETRMGTIAVVALAVIALAVLSALLKKSGKGQRRSDYEACGLMTEPEQVLYHRLIEALPGLHVMGQVALSRAVRPRGKRDLRAFRAISQKSVDFVICGPDLRPLLIVELDDSSHKQHHRKRADQTKDQAIASAGIPLIRWNVREMPDARAISEAVRKIAQSQTS
jgi:very-short-patch-repair endonuclease